MLYKENFPFMVIKLISIKKCIFFYPPIKLRPSLIIQSLKFILPRRKGEIRLEKKLSRDSVRAGAPDDAV